MKVLVPYPNAREEAEIVRRMSINPPRANRVLDPVLLHTLQSAADGVFVHDAVLDYAVRLVMATRDPAQHGLPDLDGVIAHGASPRATLGLVVAGRALALLRGREYLLPQDVYDVGRDVLRHRVLLSYEALADDVRAEDVVERVMRTVLAPRVTPTQDDLVLAVA
jgi:MoxR-like ATPase